MKKIFTLIAVALMAVGANAHPTGDNWDVPGGSTEIEITSDHATITGGKMFVTNQQDAEKTMIKKQGGEMAFQHTNNNTFFKVTLDEALKAGDVISVKMQSRTDTELGLWFKDSSDRGSEGTAKIVLATADEQSWVDAPTYTVAEGDEICGKTTFYIFRHTGKSTYFNTLVITRGGSTGINSVKTDAENGAIYNLGGQQVNEAYKGVVVKNGKKMIQK